MLADPSIKNHAARITRIKGEDNLLKENLMRLTSSIILSFALLVPASNSLLAQDYVTKDGQLAQQLKVVQQQGGFAGFTGVQFTIASDGAWTSESIFNKQITPKSKGTLSKKDLAKLGALLEKYDLAKLPATSGKQPGANPHIITFEYGKMKANLVGQMPPKLDPTNPTGTVESRFAGIWEGVVALLTPPAPPKEGQVDAKDEAIKKDRKQIKGTWRVVALVVDGNAVDDEDAKKLTVVNPDGTWSLRSDDQEITKGTSTFDPTKKLKTIDFTPTEGADKDKQYLGIYELGEKTRKMCFAPPSKERPTEYASKPGSEHILVTFEREKAK
jgi:uncharacterized protein (TIGR03067 family)